MNTKFKSQVIRALRVFVVTAAATLGATSNYSRAAVVAAVVAAIEVAVRSVWPAAVATSKVGLAQGSVGTLAASLLNVPKPPAPPAA